MLKIAKKKNSITVNGTLGTELPFSMYTTKTPLDMCRFNV
jgi:hypothetical protein